MNEASILKPLLGLPYIALTIALTVAGQLLVKMGVNSLHSRHPAQMSIIAALVRALTNWQVALGIGCAVLAAFCWILAVSKSSLSFAYPFMGLAIVLVLALSPTILKEPVSIRQWIGVLIVCLGLWVAAQK